MGSPRLVTPLPIRVVLIIKIKHVDENSGQIKENVWEFTHPNFQAGGKADLDGIKVCCIVSSSLMIQRKAVVPKKGDDGEMPAGKTTGEDPTRMAEVEGRVHRLEEQLAVALEELRQARTREMSLQAWAREMVMHVGQLERGKSVHGERPLTSLETSSSPQSSDNSISPRIYRLHQFLDNAVTPGMVSMIPPYSSGGGMSSSSSASRPYSNMPFMGAGTNHVSPMTDGSGSGGPGNSPEGSKSSNRPKTTGGEGDVIELSSQQNMFGIDEAGNIPLFADTPAWLTEGTTATMPIYHRKSSDGMTLKLVMETLANQGNGISLTAAGPSKTTTQQENGNATNNDSQDPLDNSPREEKPDVKHNQPSPFGSLIIPKDIGKKGAKARLSARDLRRSTTIVTSWTHAPKILVVEDDVVYRQLSSKFLEKFGCVIETVDNAQQAIEKMNQTRYDLVLMDIFFGPSMDG
jgi:osomolarity two-component system response regulator SKN7